MDIEEQDKFRTRLVGIVLIAVFYFAYFVSVQDYQEEKYYRAINVHSLRLADDYFSLFRNDNVENKYFAKDNIATMLLQSEDIANYGDDPNLENYLSRAKIVAFDFELFDSPERCRGLLAEDLMRPDKNADETVFFVLAARPCQFSPLPTYLHINSQSEEHFSVTLAIHRYSRQGFFACLIFQSSGCYPYRYQADFWSKFGDQNTRFASRWRISAAKQIELPDFMIFQFFKRDIRASTDMSSFDRFFFRGIPLEENIRLSEEILSERAPSGGATFFGVEVAARLVPLAVATFLFYHVTMGFQTARVAVTAGNKLSRIPLSVSNWQAVLLSVFLIASLPLSVISSALVTIGLIKQPFLGFVVSPLTGEFFNTSNAVAEVPPSVGTTWIAATAMFLLYCVTIFTSLLMAIRLFGNLYFSRHRT